MFLLDVTEVPCSSERKMCPQGLLSCTIQLQITSPCPCQSVTLFFRRLVPTHMEVPGSLFPWIVIGLAASQHVFHNQLINVAGVFCDKGSLATFPWMTTCRVGNTQVSPKGGGRCRFLEHLNKQQLQGPLDVKGNVSLPIRFYQGKQPSNESMQNQNHKIRQRHIGRKGQRQSTTQQFHALLPTALCLEGGYS